VSANATRLRSLGWGTGASSLRQSAWPRLRRPGAGSLADPPDGLDIRENRRLLLDRRPVV